MTRQSKIIWSKETEESEIVAVRKQIIDAYLAHLFYRHKRVLNKPEIGLLKRFAASLASVVPVLNRHDSLTDDLKQMIEIASHAEAERSNVKIEDVFHVSYSGKVKGIERVPASRKALDNTSRGRLRGTGAGISTLASKSYSLLVGEFNQHVAKKILESLTVFGHEVKYVRPLRPVKRRGKRVDDWIIGLSNGSEIPVEVKGSTNARYFDTAFLQIKNILEDYTHGLFVGFFLSNISIDASKKVLVILIDKSDGLPEFRSLVRKMLAN